MSQRSNASDIEDAATHWVWRLDREASNPQLEAQLEEWLAGDPRRRGAFLQAQATWALLDGVSGCGDVAVVHRKWAFAAAAGVALVAASIVAFKMWPLATQRYQTSVGEIRQVPLADGSTAAINTHSVLSVSMNTGQRIVEIEAGEAWFRVAKDARRPFIVEAGRVRVRALGTAFSVRRERNGAKVLVTEGLVETWVAGAEGHTVRVNAGAKAFVTENAAISKKAAPGAEIDRALAWRAGKIDLAGERLADAVAEFNRYNRRKLVIADARLAQERLYGVFRTDDPQGFAYAVRRSLGARVSLPDADEIRLGE